MRFQGFSIRPGMGWGSGGREGGGLKVQGLGLWAGLVRLESECCGLWSDIRV